MAIGVSALEVIGAGAIFVLLGLLTNPGAVSELLPVQVLGSLLRISDLRQLRFTVAGRAWCSSRHEALRWSLAPTSSSAS